MISYDRFWKTLENSPETYYTLVKKHGIPNSTMTKLKNNRTINLGKVNKLSAVSTDIQTKHCGENS